MIFSSFVTHDFVCLRKIALNLALSFFHTWKTLNWKLLHTSTGEMPLTRSTALSSHTSAPFLLFDGAYSHCENYLNSSISRVPHRLDLLLWKTNGRNKIFFSFSLLNFLNFIYDPFGLLVHFKVQEGIMPRRKKIYGPPRKTKKIEKLNFQAI